MALCSACQALVDGNGSEPPHKDLKFANEQIYKPFARPKIYVSDYVCQVCGAALVRTDDRDEKFKSWAVKSVEG